MPIRQSLWLGAAAMAAVLCLSGCFASEKPLIALDTADTPFPDQAKITDFTNCAGAAGALMGCQGYQRAGSATLSLRNGAYLIHPDPAANPLANVPGMPGGVQDMRVLLKKAGGALYIAQLPLGNADASPRQGDQYLYEAVQITGETAYVYTFVCEQNGDQAYVKSGALNAITTALLAPTCEANSVAGLGKIFRDRLANGAVPDRKLEVQPPG